MIVGSKTPRHNRFITLLTGVVMVVSLTSCARMEKVIDTVWGEDQRDEIDKSLYQQRRQPKSNHIRSEEDQEKQLMQPNNFQSPMMPPMDMDGKGMMLPTSQNEGVISGVNTGDSLDAIYVKIAQNDNDGFPFMPDMVVKKTSAEADSARNPNRANIRKQDMFPLQDFSPEEKKIVQSFNPRLNTGASVGHVVADQPPKPEVLEGQLGEPDERLRRRLEELKQRMNQEYQGKSGIGMHLVDDSKKNQSSRISNVPVVVDVPEMPSENRVVSKEETRRPIRPSSPEAFPNLNQTNVMPKEVVVDVPEIAKDTDPLARRQPATLPSLANDVVVPKVKIMPEPLPEKLLVKRPVQSMPPVQPVQQPTPVVAKAVVSNVQKKPVPVVAGPVVERTVVPMATGRYDGVIAPSRYARRRGE